MKKLSLALVCFIGMMFFASCDPDAINDILEQKPTVEFVSGDNLVSDFSGFWVNTELNFQIKVAPNATSNSPIASVHFAIHDLNGNPVKLDDPEIENPSGENIIDESWVSEAPSTYTVTATVKDQAGKENAVAFVVDYVAPITAVLGTYQGNVQLTGHVKTDKAVVGYSLDDDYDSGDLLTTVVLGELEESDNRVAATFEIDGRPVTLYCTMDETGENLTFDNFHFNRSVPVSGNVAVLLDVKISNASATITDGVMTLTGDTEGQGTVTGIQYLNVTATATGTINGELNEVVPE